MWKDSKKLTRSGVFIVKFDNGNINKACYNADTKQFTTDGIPLNNIAFTIPANEVNITQHKCPECGKVLLEEETSLLHCYDCSMEYYIFMGKVVHLQGASGVTTTTFTAKV